MIELIVNTIAILGATLFLMILLSANIAIISSWIEMIKEKQWTFVPCASPSNSREVMAEHILKNDGGTQFKMTVNGNTFGYEYR